MTPVTAFAGKTVALFGLGGSGLVTALALQAGGANVVACDDNPVKMSEAAERGISVAYLRQADWSSFSSFILSPGVPLTHPEPHWTVTLARRASVEIIGDIELFCQERAFIAPEAPFIAVTGTNGKSTTTALIAHILRENGWDVQMGGNIGTAVLALEPPADRRAHVIECSSFQIDLAPSLAPSIGILLNITPDHLDRHGDMANYVAIKERLVAGAVTAVISVDDPLSLPVLEDISRQNMGNAPRHLVRIAMMPRPDAEICLDGETIVERMTDGSMQAIARLDNVPALRGRHNGQNACATVAALMAAPFSVARADIARHVRSFPGLPHRMEQIGHAGRVLFINDSKATNADSAEKALLSFEHIYWIAGGKPKEGGIEPLAPYFGKIRRAYLIGEASQAFAATLEGKVPYLSCGTLERAVAAASSDAAGDTAATEPVVLLSPACASYDQYPNFEIRGDHFRKLVRSLTDFDGEVN